MLNKKTKLIFFIFIAIFLFSNLENVFAADCEDKCKTLYPADQTLQKKCSDDCEKIEKYEKIIEVKTKQLEVVNNQIGYINKEQAQNQQTLLETIKNLTSISEKITTLENSIEEKEKAIIYQKKMLSGLMQSYYDYDQQGILEIILLDNTFTNPFEQVDYISQSGVRVSDLLNEIKKNQQELVDDQKELQGSYEQSEKLKKELDDDKYELQLSENQKQKILAETQAEKAKYEKLLSEIENEIYSLESAKSVDYSKLPAAKGGYFNYPVSSVRITQSYGMTSYAKAGAYGGKPHNGIDFGISTGNNIFTARSGKVVGVGNNGKYAYGKWIAVDHGDGLLTLYGHLSSQLVSKGSKVKTGDKIGKSGNTGYSTGPHLHFSVFTSKSFETVQSKYVKGLMIPVGASINPMKYLK
ncbi:MAG: peptidoglycan DD-metalloendopeptidase family protein [Parcubacteria group bacterium]|jgi:murein DD-endopeptidase MepM/ murein hydrolase activator NlpD